MISRFAFVCPDFCIYSKRKGTFFLFHALSNEPQVISKKKSSFEK